MRDLVEMGVSIDPALSPDKRKAEFCNRLIAELSKMQGEELAPHLASVEFDKRLPGVVLALHFPLTSDIADSLVGKGE